MQALEKNQNTKIKFETNLLSVVEIDHIHIRETNVVNSIHVAVFNNACSINSVTPNLTKAPDNLILRWRKRYFRCIFTAGNIGPF